MKSERIDQLLHLWENCPNENAPEVLGFHGTSLETLERSLEIGTIIGSTSAAKYELLPVDRGDLYFFPNIGRNVSPLFNEVEEDTDNPVERAKGYAETIAVSHAASDFLGLDLAGKQARNVRNKIQDMWDDDIPFPPGISISDMKKAYEFSKHRKGLLLFLDTQILSDQKITTGDKGHGDLRIKAGPKGLSTSLIKGLRPLGEEESEWLRSLKT